MSRENENPMKALVRDFYKGIEVKIQAGTVWHRDEVLEVVRDVQVSVLAKHLARATAQLHPGIFYPPSDERPWKCLAPRPEGKKPVVESEEPPWTP